MTYNSLIVLVGTCLLGFMSGVLGSFLLIRRKSLLGDVISHSTLPGIALSVIFLSVFFNESYTNFKFEFILFGGAITGGLGLLLFYIIKNRTHLKDDVSLAVSLSIFFGLGVSLLSLVQQKGGSFATGIESYIYGKATSILMSDVEITLIASVIILIMLLIFFRVFVLISFDTDFARVKGYKIALYDFLLFLLILVVCMLSLQVVGAILMLALFVIPPAIIRFWTQDLYKVIWLSGVVGLFSAFLGVYLSIYYEGLPSGPTIVLVAFILFILSFLFGSSRGIIWFWLKDRIYHKKVNEEHLLRFWYEYLENQGCLINENLKKSIDINLTFKQICLLRKYESANSLRKLLYELTLKGFVKKNEADDYSLTFKGLVQAEQIVKKHRLWEIFLVKYADIAPSVADKFADKLEHVIEPDILSELEDILEKERNQKKLPASPHILE